MTKQNSVILYVGSDNNAQTIQDQTLVDGWMVYHPEDMEDALAMHIFEYPDVVVIEDSSSVEFARDVYGHLTSIHAKNIILFSDRPQTWGAHDMDVRVAHSATDVADIIAEVRLVLCKDSMQLTV